MSEIIEATYKLLDDLENSEVIKKLTYYKQEALKNPEVLNLVKNIKEEKSQEEKVKLKKQLYEHDDYKNYMDAYNTLFYIVLKINRQYKKYTNTKGFHIDKLD